MAELYLLTLVFFSFLLCYFNFALAFVFIWMPSALKKSRGESWMNNVDNNNKRARGKTYRKRKRRVVKIHTEYDTNWSFRLNRCYWLFAFAVNFFIFIAMQFLLILFISVKWESQRRRKRTPNIQQSQTTSTARVKRMKTKSLSFCKQRHLKNDALEWSTFGESLKLIRFVIIFVSVFFLSLLLFSRCALHITNHTKLAFSEWMRTGRKSEREKVRYTKRNIKSKVDTQVK